MNEDQIADLKQFISATISQQISLHLAEQTDTLRGDMTTLEQRLGKRIDNLSAFVAEALDAANDQNEATLKDHEHRITRLEHKAA